MAIGYYDRPNRLGVEGEDLPHVSHYYRDAHPFYRKRATVVGGSNSAAEASLELYRAGAKVTLVHRRAALSREVKYWVLPDIENRIKEGSIRAIMCGRVSEILPDSVLIESDSGTERVPSDAVFLLTGYHPDFALLAGAGGNRPGERPCLLSPGNLRDQCQKPVSGRRRRCRQERGAGLHRERLAPRGEDHRGDSGPACGQIAVSGQRSGGFRQVARSRKQKADR